MLHRKVLFIGPSLDTVTGQSFSFSSLKDFYIDSPNSYFFYYPVLYNANYLSYTYKFISFFYNLLIARFFIKYDKIYLSFGRTRISVLRDFFTVILLKKTHIPIIVHLHGSDLSGIEKRIGFFRFLLIIYMRQVSIGVVLSKSMCEQFKNFPWIRIIVISNFSNPQINLDLSFNSNPFKILYFSNIMYSKGIFHLIEAISYMRQSNIPVELHICGLFLSDRYMTSSVLKKTFFDTISDNDNIFFHGFADSSKKSYFYSQADVFCLPTFYETEAQPISIIEAMSFGLPIVSTSFKYIPDLVSANSGILVPPKSSESIFDALKYLYYNRNVRKKYGYFNLTFHNKYFTKTVYFKNFAQLLNS